MEAVLSRLTAKERKKMNIPEVRDQRFKLRLSYPSSYDFRCEILLSIEGR